MSISCVMKATTTCVCRCDEEMSHSKAGNVLFVLSVMKGKFPKKSDVVLLIRTYSEVFSNRREL